MALDLTALFSGEVNLIIILTFFTAVIVLYSVFVFYFYRFLAKKNIIELNLNQYNQSANPTLVKLFAALFYVIEYIIILPILTFFWFSILSILLLLLSKELAIGTILLISAALVASVRITAHVSEDLSKDLAKMLPFTLLAIAITTSVFFDINALLSRAKEIPSLFSNLPYYLIFIIATELIMRVFTFISDTIQSSKTHEEISQTEEQNPTE